MTRRRSKAAKTENAVGAFDAKTNLAQLLNRVEHGESIIITRHGEPVARLVPFDTDVDRDEVRRTVIALKRFGRTNRLPHGVTLKDLINEGRS